jgi:hypothetical protein
MCTTEERTGYDPQNWFRSGAGNCSPGCCFIGWQAFALCGRWAFGDVVLIGFGGSCGLSGAVVGPAFQASQASTIWQDGRSCLLEQCRCTTSVQEGVGGGPWTR